MDILNVFKSKSNVDGIKKSKSVEDLIKALGNYDDTDRIQATLALGEIGDPETIGPLIRSLKDYNSDVREYSAIALEKIGKPAVESATRMALLSPRHHLNWAASHFRADRNERFSH